MDDFYEKNPELKRITLEERIEGFVDAYGYTTARVNSISSIPGTDSLLIGGGSGALYEYQKQPDDSYRLGKRIDGFVDANGKPTGVTSITPIPGTANLLIGRGDSALCECQKQLDGSYQLGEGIEGFVDVVGNPAWINSISPISGTDNLLIGGDSGALCECQKQLDGSYQLGERIEGFVDAYGDPAAWINSIAPIPGTDNLLIGGGDGALYEYQKQPDDSHQLGKRIDGFVAANGDPASVTSIAPIPGTANLLIGGGDGALYEYQKQPDGSYQLGERIEGFVDAYGNPAWIGSIAPIPGTDNLLIGGEFGTLYEYQKQPDGSYQLGERIDGFVKANGNPASVTFIAPMPGTANLLIGGSYGTLYEAHVNNPSLSNLKKALPQIVHNN